MERQKYWTELLYIVAAKDVTQYDILKRTDIVEFFHLVDRFKAAHQPPKKK